MKICKFGGSTGAVLATCTAAIAGDVPSNIPVKAPVPYITKAPRIPIAKNYDWSGWYVGAMWV
jgi:high affinity Mn2+ porin